MAIGDFSGSSGIRRWVGVALATMLLVGCDSPEERLASHYERGVELVAEGRLEQAGLEFRNALQINSEHAPSRLEIGKIAEANGTFDVAARNYRLAAELDETDAESRMRLARILVAANLVDDAESFIAEAIALEPQNAEALAVRSSVLLRKDDIEGAVEAANAALAIDPGNVPATVVLANERLRAGDPDGAVALIDAQLESQPLDQALNIAKLQIVGASGDSAAVGAHLVKMVERFPEQQPYRQALVRWRMSTGDVEGAERDLRSIAALDPEANDPKLMIVRFIYETRGAEAAEAELKAQIDSAASAAQAATMKRALAEFYIRENRAAEGEAMLREVAANQDDAEVAASANVRLAELRLAEGDRDAARRIVEKVLEEDEENVGALAVRASVAIDEYRPTDAISDLRRALAGDPQNARLMVLEARAHERNGNLTLSGERLAAAARASDYAPEIAGLYVQFLRARSELSGAEAVLSEIARRHPDNRSVLASLAEVRLQIGDWVGAEQAGQQLRALGGADATAAQITAAALSGQGRVDAGISILEDQLAQPGGDDRAVASLVASYVNAGEVDKAVALLNGVLAEDPENIRALLLMAEIDLLDGDRDAALARLQTIVDAHPDNQIGYLAQTRLLLQNGRVAEAEAIATKGLDMLGRSDPLLLLKAQMLEARGAFDEAIDAYRTLYDQNPESVMYANNLASLLAEHRSDDAESMAFAQRVAQRLRGYDVPHLQDTYGWIMFLGGETEVALRSLVAAAEGLPDNPLVRYHLGRAYAAADQFGPARENLEAALSLDAAFPKAESARAALAELPTTIE